MCYPSEQSISSYEASKVNPAIVAKPGIYGTGKGTTARILEALKGTTFETRMTASQIAEKIDVSARQLSKRLSELENKFKVSVVNGTGSKLLEYYAA